MPIVDAPSVPSIMAIAAHPDDIESWCAGTLAHAISLQATVSLLLVTSGEHGTDKNDTQPAVIAAEREQEARNAAQHLGIGAIEFLRYPDGDVENSRALRRDDWGKRGAAAGRSVKLLSLE